jgi:hypothetical protein
MPRSMREQFRYYRHCASAIPRMDGEHVAHEWPSSVSSTIPFAKPFTSKTSAADNWGLKNPKYIDTIPWRSQQLIVPYIAAGLDAVVRSTSWQHSSGSFTAVLIALLSKVDIYKRQPQSKCQPPMTPLCW